MTSPKTAGRKTYREHTLIDGDARPTVQKDSKDIETYIRNWVSTGRINTADGKGVTLTEPEYFGMHTITTATGQAQVPMYVYVATYSKRDADTGNKHHCESTIYEWDSPVGSRKTNNLNTHTNPLRNH